MIQVGNVDGEHILVRREKWPNLNVKSSSILSAILSNGKTLITRKCLEKARAEIRKSWEQTCKITGDDPNKLPPFLDPFAGGGSIPLEAQRLGLEAHASDLNPVAVMICKALIEIPPKFAGLKPVGPIPATDKQKKMKVTEEWSGAKGLAEDVRRYGHWMRDEAFKRIGHLYPQVELPKEYGGGKANVIAWLWARTVSSPNPGLQRRSCAVGEVVLALQQKG